MQPSLRLGNASSATTEIVIREGEQVLGRSADADHVVAEDFVSGHHAKLQWHDGRLSILDLDSTNGTLVNGVAVVGWTSLADGDLVQFAGVEATVRFPQPATNPASTRQMLRPPQAADLLSTNPPTPRSTPVIPPPSPDSVAPNAFITAPAPSPQPPGPTPEPARRTHRGGRTRAVFVSYASEDSVAAESLCRYLDRAGWEVWRDADVLKGGDNWSAEIAQALRNTDAMIVLITDDSMVSRWVRREVRAADRAGMPILPVRIGQPPIPDELALIINELHQVTVNEFESSVLPVIEDDLMSLLDRPGMPDAGRTQILVGNVLWGAGIVGVIVAFGMFFIFGYQAVTESLSVEAGLESFEETRSRGQREFARFAAAFALFIFSAILAAIGQGMQRSGRRKQI